MGLLAIPESLYRVVVRAAVLEAPLEPLQPVCALDERASMTCSASSLPPGRFPLFALQLKKLGANVGFGAHQAPFRTFHEQVPPEPLGEAHDSPSKQPATISPG